MNDLPTKHRARFLGWRMVALACLCTNVGAGFTFAAYGTFMPPMATEFSASRSLATGGLPLMTAIMGLLAPVAAYTSRRYSIRATLAAGYMLMSIGWAFMSHARNTWQFIVAFGVLCGAGAACLISVPPMTLINNWFIADRGKAMGIAMLLVVVVVTPTVAAVGINAYGWRVAALVISFVTLLLSPLTLLVIDNPESIGQQPLRATPLESAETEVEQTSLHREQKVLTRDPIFWLLIFFGGLYISMGVVLSVHLVPFALGLNMNLTSAALLASIYGGAGLVGGFFGGAVADRIGGARTFIVAAFLQVAVWPCLLLPIGYTSLAMCVAVIGLCINAMVPVISTLVANVFGRAQFSRVMGLFSILTMPFGIVLPLLAGALYDFSGSYREVFLIQAGMFAIVGIAFCFAYRLEVERLAELKEDGVRARRRDKPLAAAPALSIAESARSPEPRR